MGDSLFNIDNLLIETNLTTIMFMIFIVLLFFFFICFLFNLTHTQKRELFTWLSRGLLLTLLAVAEARVISTKVSENDMNSEFSIRDFPFDIV